MKTQNKRLNMRISDELKAEIESESKLLGLTVTDYVLGLHHHRKELQALVNILHFYLFSFYLLLQE